jgi:AcrR family transcriptional regulator
MVYLFAMRIIKEPEERRNEILDAAEQLFASRGYDAATVSDILAAVNIAKGTFYYYFKSKEDALDAIVERRISYGIAEAEEIVKKQGPSVYEKFLAVIMAQKPRSQIQEAFNSVLHESGNVKFHQKVLTETVLRLSPILQSLVEEGIQQGLFSTSYARESVELLLASALVVFDDGFFHWTEAEIASRIPAFLEAMERILGAKPGAFSYMASAFNTNPR